MGTHGDGCMLWCYGVMVIAVIVVIITEDMCR